MTQIRCFDCHTRLDRKELDEYRDQLTGSYHVCKNTAACKKRQAEGLRHREETPTASSEVSTNA